MEGRRIVSCVSGDQRGWPGGGVIKKEPAGAKRGASIGGASIGGASIGGGFRGEADSFRWGWWMFPCHQVLYQSPEDNPHSDKVELTVYTHCTLSEFGFSLRCDLI